MNLPIRPATPPHTRVYAIGDVHGRLDLLDDLLRQIEVDAQTAPRRRVLVMLGDYIDRGPASRGVLERLEDLLDGRRLEGFEIRLLMGNHEQVMLDFLDGRDDGQNWLVNGGAEAMSSFGLDAALPAPALRDALHDALSPAHRRVLHALALRHEEGGYGFVHAGVRPGVAWPAQVAEDLLWIRREFLLSHEDFGRVIVHGHSPEPAPQVHDNRIGIDTRAWLSGVLTAVVLEGGERRFLST